MDDQCRRLTAGESRSPLRRDVKIACATHLMHLKENRYVLYREAETLLQGEDRPPDA
jgi:hypothetical protein